jgi:hypothetical protein
VESTRHGVAATTEFSSRVKDCQNNFDRRFLFRGVHIDGDSSSVVDHSNSAIREDRDVDQAAVTSECLVHGVVDDFVDQMVQTTFARRADVHAGAFANGF